MFSFFDSAGFRPDSASSSLLNPHDFVRWLAERTRVWRRTAGRAAGSNRHVRSLRRQWIRRYKARYKLEDLPRENLASTFQQPWTTGDGTEPKLVVPQQEESRTSDAAVLRKRLRSILHRTVGAGSKGVLELINASNSARGKLPSLGSRFESKHLRRRGVYLEALGAAIIPDLDQREVERLKSEGALVLSNTDLTLELPSPELSVGNSHSFWHRVDLPLEKATNLPKYTGKGASIGVLDTGIDATHEEFFNKNIVYREFDRQGIIQHTKVARDFQYHGTHVSGICSGLNAGIAPDAHLSVAAVLTRTDGDSQIGGTLFQVIAGLNWLAQSAGPAGDGVDIINASLGFEKLHPTDARVLHAAVEGVRENEGTLVIAAIGNSGKHGKNHHGAPGCFGHVVAVGAIDKNKSVASFSSWGDQFGSTTGSQSRSKPDLVAPGVAVNSCIPNGQYAKLDGTSMASPCVAGAAALLLEAFPHLRRNPNLLTEKLLSLTSHYQH